MTRSGYLLWLLLAVVLAAVLALAVSARVEQRGARQENAALLAHIVRQADLAAVAAQVKGLEAQMNGLADGFDIHMRQAGKFHAGAASTLPALEDYARATVCMEAQALAFWLLVLQGGGPSAAEIVSDFTGQDASCLPQGGGTH